MGRRALRKIDPAVDLSRHLARLDDLTPPWCDEALFPQPAPLEIEVGSGKGLFLVTAAMARPETNFLGVEVRRKYAEYTAGRLARRDLVGPVDQAAQCFGKRRRGSVAGDADGGAVRYQPLGHHIHRHLRVGAKKNQAPPRRQRLVDQPVG